MDLVAGLAELGYILVPCSMRPTGWLPFCSYWAEPGTLDISRYICTVLTLHPHIRSYTDNHPAISVPVSTTYHCKHRQVVVVKVVAPG